MNSVAVSALHLAAFLTFVAALLHYACIAWGAPGFRFLGAGEPIAQMAERGHWYPTFISIAIGTVLLVSAAYALSAAGAIARLPLQRLILPAIAAVFLLRAVAFPWLKPIFPDNSRLFWLLTSGICLLIGSLYAFGIHAVWEQL
ncbi:MAG: hypothetical protein CVU33_11655 [Betaproteobacteria bacterium HGW-Betaproteobacteria-6]|jgi:hypothetical protein|nr:MAG: hypothetical protein CVU33_11655 [Betaproteobacteria bacterium HGW-Betaproteobacteria-6]